MKISVKILQVLTTGAFFVNSHLNQHQCKQWIANILTNTISDWSIEICATLYCETRAKINAMLPTKIHKYKIDVDLRPNNRLTPRL